MGVGEVDSRSRSCLQPNYTLYIIYYILNVYTPRRRGIIIGVGYLSKLVNTTSKSVQNMRWVQCADKILLYGSKHEDTYSEGEWVIKMSGQ